MMQPSQQTSPNEIKRVMISSTALDLPEHRNKVKDACLQQGMFPIMMEHLPANDADAIAESLRMVNEADIYLGIFAHRYGHVPENYDISVTEMEYKRAVERGIPRLIFLMHEDHPLKAADVERGENAVKLDALKARLKKEQVVNFFKSPDQLHAQVINSLSRQPNLIVFQQTIIPGIPKVYPNLPPQYGEFLGREKDVARVLEGLNLRWPLISIEGLGGVGKTTLAIEIGHYCLNESRADLDQPFEAVVWVSAKDRPEQKRWLNEVLDTTARVLGYPSISQMPSEQKLLEVDQLLRNVRTLVIVDNFETIEDSDLEAWIQRVPEPSKALITTRYAQMRRVWDIHLKGLEESEALDLIRNHGRRLELLTIENAGREDLLPLVRVTEGNPKAIEMALGYVKRGRLSLKEVVDHLHAASKSVEGVFDYLFAHVWNILTKQAQQVLLVLPFFADSASKEALGAVAGLTGYHLDTALEKLVELALLDINAESAVSNQRYSTHPLTRAFANTKLCEAQEFEEQARIRWCTYYLDFATRHLVREKPKERYWNTLARYGFTPIDQEWLNIRKVLSWTDQEGQDHILTELMLLLVHYMDGRFLYFDRIYYSCKSAEAAIKLGRRVDAALFRIDALGWTLIEEGRIEDAEQEITCGLRIIENMSDASNEVSDLITLVNTFLARVFLEQGDTTKASEFVNKVISIQCKPVIQYRVHMIAGDIAHKQKNYPEAMRYYENAYQVSLQYGGEKGNVAQLHYRLGLAYLAHGDIVDAEIRFNKVLEDEQNALTIEVIYAKYGLACIAQAQGERDKARLLAEDILNELSHRTTSHKLLKQIQEFLKTLEAT